MYWCVDRYQYVWLLPSSSSGEVFVLFATWLKSLDTYVFNYVVPYAVRYNRYWVCVRVFLNNHGIVLRLDFN